MTQDGNELPNNLRAVLSALQAREIAPAEAKEVIEALLSGRQRASNLLNLKPAAEPAVPTQQRASTASLKQLQNALAASLAEALYVNVEDIDTEKSFAELGLDSIIAAEWARTLKRDYASFHSVTALYDHPNVRRLALSLAAEVKEQTPAPRTVVQAKNTAASGIESELIKSIAETLYMDPAEIDPVRAFAELGLDSILAAEWLRMLNLHYGTSIPASHLYDHPNTRALAQFLETQLAAEPARPPSPPMRAAALPSVRPQQPRDHAIEPCAIIGMSGRYPRSHDLDEYWSHLEQGTNCIQPIAEDRWDTSLYYDPRAAQSGKINCKWLGSLDDIASFDPLFFGISPADAELMDPQHRIFLEEAYRAFEDAGYTPRSLGGRKCGVYLGIMGNEYRSLLLEGGVARTDTTGNSSAIGAGRIAYFLDLKGPAISIDTACSSSLVAIHLACQALQRGEIDMALAGGVTLYLSPEPYLAMCGAGMLSPTGLCKSFDNSADGFVPGEGAGAVVLKRLSDAEADGDRIYGVVVGSGINQDGKTNGITAPSAKSQVELLRDVYRHHNIHPDTISYVEAHGTGTRLGDPIELEALAAVFKEKTARKGFCALGSVKANIGHTSAAAGVAGVQKVLLAMKHGNLPPNPHFNIPNEHFDFAGSPFFVNTEVRPWRPNPEGPRRAAVSSFGFSGTNAHLVMDEYQAEHRALPSDSGGTFLILLSAKSRAQLRTYAQALERHLIAQSTVDLRDLAYTLQTGRAAMEYRVAIIADSREDLVSSLEQFVEHGAGPDIRVGDATRMSRGDSALQADEDAGVLLETWLLKKKWNKLAKVWVEGLEVDWAQLYVEGLPQRISLPTYPFAKERYWAPGQSARSFPHRSADRAPASIHPLLQQNISNLDGLRFSTKFDGDEWFLTDHKVQGRKVLSGAACLEMARAAAAYAHSLLTSQDRSLSIVLTDVAFAQPLIVDQARTVYIAVHDGKMGALRYEVASGEADAREVYTMGWARIEQAQPVQLDMRALRQGCTRQISAGDCYAAFSKLGLDYGPAHRGIQELATGTDEHGVPFAMAHLNVPAAETDKTRELSLHPGLLDSALQAGLMGLGDPSASAPSLPFAIEQVILLAPPPERCLSIARRGGEDVAHGIAQHLDVDICDENGNVCVRIIGFISRRLHHAIDQQQKPAVLISSAREQQEPRELMYAVRDHSDDALLEHTGQLLRGVLATTAKLAKDRIDAHAPLEQYGIDSIMILRLTSELEKQFGPLSKTLFFEYRTLHALGGYFVAKYRERLQKLFPVHLPAENLVAVAGSGQKNASPISRPALVRRISLPSTAGPADIAIVGLSGRYPGAKNTTQFWQNLKAGRDSITEIPSERWDYHAYYDAEKGKPGKSYSKWGGFLEKVDCFDSLFFNISPREAQAMDPQERIFLECVYATLEDAGYTRETVGGGDPGKVGVFVGVMYDEYPFFGVQAQALGEPFANPGNLGSIANRVSYFCNFNGPSMVVDTMCSSSLTAIHLACQSVQRGECVTAVAGGVNVSIHPNKYLSLSQGQFVSSKGRCESFGEGGDGYVPGEGVGAVLLKPLWRAEADGDHIYGVIKASALNHGGKTNGYSVPNPQAQAAVISRALSDSGIPARAVTYVEAHGTGTSLGDPIEVAGLHMAFSAATAEKGFCALGSAKSNIGHCESAAGIAGLTKVLLQMQHGQLAPSLHAERVNPNIEFTGGPFSVQRELREWQRPQIGGRDYPRVAGLSSFGAGGANAHMVISEYLPTAPQNASTGCNVLIVLSARQQDQLRLKVEQLLEVVTGLGDDVLESVAYTLQVGREAMDYRLALSVHSMPELRHRLKRFLAEESGIEDLHLGEVKRNKETLSVFAADEDMQATIEAWVAKGKYSKLLALWVKGLVFDWGSLYGERKPRRIPLPSYPFAPERHWIAPIAAERGPKAMLHPLLQRNTSDLEGVSFTTSLHGDEFFFADHIVQGRKVLPGAAHLEIARAAVEQACQATRKPSQAIVLRNVAFAEPLFGEEPVELRIELEQHAEKIAYRIESLASGSSRLHVEGWAELEAFDAKHLDIPRLLAAQHTRIDPQECYAWFSRIGLEYGVAHRAIDAMWLGRRDDEEFVVARLRLPPSLVSTSNQFVWHPGLMDAALQSVAGFAMNRAGAAQATVPFALEEVLALAPVPNECFAVATVLRAGDAQKFYVDVCDAAGSVCVQLKGLSLRPIEIVQAQSHSGVTSSADHVLMTFRESLEREEIKLPAGTQSSPKRLVCLLSDPERQRAMEESLRRLAPETRVAFVGLADAHRCGEALKEIEARQGPTDAVLYLWPLEDRSLSQDYSRIVSVVQAIGHALPRCPRVVLAGEYREYLDRSYIESWIGFGRSLRLVLPETRVTVLAGEFEGIGPSWLSHWAERLWKELREPEGHDVVYEAGARLVYRLHPTSPYAGDRGKLRQRGTYLITGGAGGLGLLLARHLVRKYSANLVLTGRSAPSDSQIRLQTIQHPAAQILYVQADACDREQMRAALAQAHERFGPIHGVIHAAGIEGGESILDKDFATFARVLAPKVAGTLVLEDLLLGEALDFICYFSSSSAILGDFGSCDYSVGNRFQMAYAQQRNRLREQGKRNGIAIAINWPLWKEGGMGFSQEAEVLPYIEWSGQSAIETSEGLALFEELLAGEEQRLVLRGKPDRLRQLLRLPHEKLPQAAPRFLEQPSQDAFTSQAIEYLRRVLGPALKLSPAQVEPDAPFEQYGIDSIMVLRLTGELEKHFGPLAKTLFFEFRSVAELGGYLARSHAVRLHSLLGVNEAALAPRPLQLSPEKRMARGRRRPRGDGEKKGALDVAIVGLSGRYPGAGSVDEFWQNLKTGRDSITEIPAERWDYRLYFDGQKGKPGKTYSKWGGFLKDADRFDSMFFNISPAEAQRMDPQERLFLECVWATLEDAGYTRDTVGGAGEVGVFAGVMYEEYQMYGAQAQMLGPGYALPGNAASIANRISYFCNFHGPSMAVDTMCSSSITAIHLACQSLERGECTAAFAGGVNLSVHPNKYLGLSQGQFVSSKGRCESFGEGGDGYVPGEGVGAVLLKPLWRAEADGDHIYGIIKSSALNHGGKTNGYNVPNPQAQAAVIGQALRSSGFPARAVSYIEAHGTGTSLGDPIEITGLERAFATLTEEKGFCAVGSAKSNIGHCESAAGIAGLTKILLQMQHGQLAPSLHAERLNPHIQFDQSPFLVQRELALWERPHVGDREYPRVAGLSSFGAGGANAHMLISEYASAERAVTSEEHPRLIVLSARQPDQLRLRAEQLLQATAQIEDGQLTSLAYTLQIGREAMEHRLALTIRSMDELRHALERYLGGEQVEGLYQGEVKRHKEGLSAFAGDEDLQVAVEAWVAKGKYGKLLDLWVRGFGFEWRRLYGEQTPHRLSLPTYPFARERHWVAPLESPVRGSQAILHPLLHQNISDLEGLRFSSTFNGQESFLADHVIEGHKTLPGVAYLEMARAAAEHAGRSRSGATASGIYLRNALWMQPLAVAGEHTTVYVTLQPKDAGEFQYEISSSAGVHAQGLVLLKDVADAPEINLSRLRDRQTRRYSGAECYAAFSAMGIEYGTHHRGIQQILVGFDQDRRFALAEVVVPAALRECVLHPGMMDSALQSSMALSTGKVGALSLPFALESVEIFAPCPERAQVVIYEIAGKLDLDICNHDGHVCVRMSGFTARPVEKELVETLLFAPYFEETFAAREEATETAYTEHYVFLCELGEDRSFALCAMLPGVHCVTMQATDADIAGRFDSYVSQLVESLQAILTRRPNGEILLQVLIPTEGDGVLLFGLAGLLKTARLENAKLIPQIIGVELDQTAEDITARINENIGRGEDCVIRYDHGKRQVERFQQVLDLDLDSEPEFAAFER